MFPVVSTEPTDANLTSSLPHQHLMNDFDSLFQELQPVMADHQTSVDQTSLTQSVSSAIVTEDSINQSTPALPTAVPVTSQALNTPRQNIPRPQNSNTSRGTDPTPRVVNTNNIATPAMSSPAPTARRYREPRSLMRWDSAYHPKRVY